MLHKEFWGLVFLAFVVWIFMASDGQARIARTCRPLMWTGNVAVSLTAFAVPSGAESVQKWSNKFDYGCRYTVWRLFYQDEYIKAVQGQGTGTSAPAVPVSPGQSAPQTPVQAPNNVKPAVAPPTS